MDGRNAKHGPRLDDEMAKETQGVVESESGGARVEEWHEPEPEEPAPHTPGGGSAPSGMTPDERDTRSRLGQFLRRSAFPARREALLAEVSKMAAPDDIVEIVAGLPPQREFGNVAEVWAAVTGQSEPGLESRF